MNPALDSAIPRITPPGYARSTMSIACMASICLSLWSSSPYRPSPLCGSPAVRPKSRFCRPYGYAVTSSVAVRLDSQIRDYPQKHPSSVINIADACHTNSLNAVLRPGRPVRSSSRIPFLLPEFYWTKEMRGKISKLTCPINSRLRNVGDTCRGPWSSMPRHVDGHADPYQTAKGL